MRETIISKQQQVLDCVSKCALSQIMNHVNLIKLIFRHSIAVNYCIATNQLSAVSSACYVVASVSPCSIKNWINDSPIELFSRSRQCSEPLRSELWFAVSFMIRWIIDLTFRHRVSEQQITHDTETRHAETCNRMYVHRNRIYWDKA